MSDPYHKEQAVRRTKWLIVAVLTLVSAPPRFNDLGALSFAGDEDYSWIATRSVLEGHGSRMPSGLAYRRALPLTWTYAGVVSLLGEREGAYRATSAVFGTLTPAALFVAGSALVGPSAALVGSLMLALSEWHIGLSRIARMYAPFLFFYVLAGHFFWRWATEGSRRDGVVGMALFATTVSLQILGLMAIQFVLVPIALGAAFGQGVAVAGATILGAAALYSLNTRYVDRPYAELSLPSDFLLDGLGAAASPAVTPGLQFLGAAVVLGGVGAALGLWLGLRSEDSSPGHLQRLSRTGAFSVAGAFTGAGFLWGAFLSGVTGVLLSRCSLLQLLRRSLVPTVALVFVGVAWAAYAVGALGLGAGARRIGTVPFPNVVHFWYLSPTLVVLFAGSIAWLLLDGKAASRPGLIGSALAVVLPMFAIGLLEAPGAPRYLAHVYPYMLLCAAAFVVHLVGRVASTLFNEVAARRWGFAVGAVLVSSGIIQGHGIPQAIAAASPDHGVAPNARFFGLRPDHRGPGEFVRTTRQPDDVVIAEEPITQSVYAGRVDYWFRGGADARQFLYLDSTNTVRDIYVDAEYVGTADKLHAIVDRAPGRVWFITSGETVAQRSYYLTEGQRSWLDSLESATTPAFVGADSVTSVYCLNCAR